MTNNINTETGLIVGHYAFHPYENPDIVVQADVRPDPAEITAMVAAAEAGDVAAQQKLDSPDLQFRAGEFYVRGVGVLQDYREALNWLTPAANKGHPGAQCLLGAIYEGGCGITKDLVLAHFWWNISAANGNEVAADRRDYVAVEMDQGSLGKARSMASEWMASHTRQSDPQGPAG